MPGSHTITHWGKTPWTVDFSPTPRPFPESVDFAVVGGGFTGLSTAAWLRKLEPLATVALLEAGSLGCGASGHTGGLALAETAAGDLPELGDVLAGFSGILREFSIDCDLTLPGVWELARRASLPDSRISWTDSGDLHAVNLVPGGTIDPGKLVSGLARTAESLGVQIFEHTEVTKAEFHNPLQLHVKNCVLRAQNVMWATNAMSLELSSLVDCGEPRLTLALATEALTSAQWQTLGLETEKPFYTVDFPYLWGRHGLGETAIFGSGLVRVKDWRELADVDVAKGAAAEMFDRLERRVRGLHPVLNDVKVTHRWGGPILIADEWRPIFATHPQNPRAVVLGAYSGHGVALSVYLGRWAAAAMLGRRELPNWPLKRSDRSTVAHRW